MECTSCHMYIIIDGMLVNINSIGRIVRDGNGVKIKYFMNNNDIIHEIHNTKRICKNRFNKLKRKLL